MKLIVGLGNPGGKYAKNRHNVGFMMVDAIINELMNSRINALKQEKKFDSELSEFNINNEKILFLKPQIFMNRSGEAVRKVKDFYKIALEDIFVIHDDLDIRFGEFKIVKGKGPKIHNGIISIEQHLLAQNFMRVRIGVDNRNAEYRVPGDQYVLADFKHEEIKILTNVFLNIFTNIFIH